MPSHPYPIELKPVDISPYCRGNTGVAYVTTLESGRPGPHVMINALVHGNELCGAIALDSLLRAGIGLKRGRLTLSFANVAAYERFEPRYPEASRFVDEDMNRLWSPEILDGAGASVERARARELRPIVDRADVLLDIHSMQHHSPPLALAGPLEKGRRLAALVGMPAYVVSDGGHKAGVRLRDYGPFSDPASSKAALLVECGQHWEAATAKVAEEVALRFLAALDVIGGPAAAGALAEAPPQRFIEVTEAVTILSESFVFTRELRGLEVIERAGTLIARDGEREVRTPYDRCVVVMPSERLEKGLTAVRLGRFVG